MTENCGTCPSTTYNMSINCTIVNIRDQVCTFSIQSLSCDMATSAEGANSTITAVLKGKNFSTKLID